MAFLKISKNYLNILMIQLFLTPFFLFVSSATVSPIKFDLYLNDEEFSAVRLIKVPLLSIGCSSLLNYHRLPEVSE